MMVKLPDEIQAIDDDVIKFEIITVDIDNRHKRKFSWEVTTYNSFNCTIQITWDSPPWISSTSARDKLTFEVLDQAKFITPRKALFSDKSDGKYLASGEWELDLQPQA